MKILITGGSGYKGSVLIPLLLKDGHKIVSIDTDWFGNHLESHENLITIKDDIRNLNIKILKGIDSIIHLANIANDPAVDLNPNLSWEVNVLSSYQLIDKAVRAKSSNYFMLAQAASMELRAKKKLQKIWN